MKFLKINFFAIIALLLCSNLHAAITSVYAVGGLKFAGATNTIVVETTSGGLETVFLEENPWSGDGILVSVNPYSPFYHTYTYSSGTYTFYNVTVGRTPHAGDSWYLVAATSSSEVPSIAYYGTADLFFPYYEVLDFEDYDVESRSIYEAEITISNSGTAVFNSGSYDLNAYLRGTLSGSGEQISRSMNIYSNSSGTQSYTTPALTTVENDNEIIYLKIPDVYEMMYNARIVLELDEDNDYTETNESNNQSFVFGLDVYPYGYLSGEITILNNEGSLENAKIYPNPSNGIFNIDLDVNSIVQAEIISSSGQVVYSEQLNGLNNNINLTNYSKGLYVIKLSDGQNTKLHKLLVK